MIRIFSKLSSPPRLQPWLQPTMSPAPPQALAPPGSSGPPWSMKATWNGAKPFCKSRSWDMGQGVYPGRGCTQGSSQIPGPGWTQHRVGYKHGPYLAKGPNSKVLSNSRVELDSQMGSMGLKLQAVNGNGTRLQQKATFLQIDLL